jgi:hypothetical protein
MKNCEKSLQISWKIKFKWIKIIHFEHGGEVVLVRPGIDNATYLNLLTNYAEVSGIKDRR